VHRSTKRADRADAVLTDGLTLMQRLVDQHLLAGGGKPGFGDGSSVEQSSTPVQVKAW
jgi:hypothetical protein